MREFTVYKTMEKRTENTISVQYSSIKGFYRMRLNAIDRRKKEKF
jgi:hypothetical protein